jgi:hypothetical protein
MKRELKEASEAFKVKLTDPRSFSNIFRYLKIAVPSMFLLLLEWSA